MWGAGVIRGLYGVSGLYWGLAGNVGLRGQKGYR